MNPQPSTSAPAPRLLDVRAGAVFLGLSVHSVYRLIEARALPFVALGRRRLLDLVDLEAWIKRNKVRALPAKALDRAPVADVERAQPTTPVDAEGR